MTNRAGQWQAFAVLGILGAALGACGDETDRISELNSVRIVAVRADLPYAKPGATVTAQMLVVDGAPNAISSDGTPRKIGTLWMTGCSNPLGDLYYNCFPQLHEHLKSVSDEELQAATDTKNTKLSGLGFQPTLKFEMPIDTISSRPQSSGISYPYGVTYLFYAACAGELRVNRGADTAKDYPVSCYKPDTEQALGPQDFEFGYYPVYAYEQLANEIPIVESLKFDAAGSNAACSSDSDCASTEACSSQSQCILRVQSCKNNQNCKGYGLAFTVDPKSVEKAVSARVSLERAPDETLWASYYSDFGQFEKDSRIIYDSTSGFTDSYNGLWSPKLKDGQRGAPREAQIYIVIRDSRGGVTWMRQDVYVE